MVGGLGQLGFENVDRPVMLTLWVGKLGFFLMIVQHQLT